MHGANTVPIGAMTLWVIFRLPWLPVAAARVLASDKQTE
jgi:hypothetical protein